MCSPINKAYELVPEVYRQQFRNSRKEEKQTFTEFAREKEIQFDCWCASKEVSGDFNKLRQLILLEEFKSCLSPHIKTYLDERNAHQAAVLAGDYPAHLVGCTSNKPLVVELGRRLQRASSTPLFPKVLCHCLVMENKCPLQS